MLIAGYGSVVGTMWSILDDAVSVAEEFYEYLINDAGGFRDGTRAAYALHDAVSHLRNLSEARETSLVGCHTYASISAQFPRYRPNYMFRLRKTREPLTIHYANIAILLLILIPQPMHQLV